VLVVEDVYGRNADRSIAYAPSGKPNLMSDGNGLISLNLATMIPEVSGGRRVGGDEDEHAPLACQGRLFCNGAIAKGVWTTQPALPDGYLLVNKTSMLKV
jgi:hypothetical protein